MRRGFSLVELSIVLVILGLLVGGILAGKSLIRAAELRSVTTDYQRFVTAAQAFRDKYFYLPGDIPNAETIWGQVNASGSTCRDTATTGTLTCNGDGDGYVEIQTGRSRESLRFWQQLATAGLIEGNYTGTWDGTNLYGTIAGVNGPASKVGSASWHAFGQIEITQQGGWYANIFQPVNSANWLQLGTPTTTSSNLPALRTEEAWNVDSKMDDGMPGTGKVTTFNPTYLGNCASSTTAASATYKLDYTAGVACTMFFGF